MYAVPLVRRRRAKGCESVGELELRQAESTSMAPKAAVSSAQAIVRVALWYSVTLLSNYFGNYFVHYREQAAISSPDISLSEMLLCTVWGIATLACLGIPVIPPTEIRGRLLFLAAANASAVRCFYMSAALIQLSLLQTVRSCQPLVVTVVVYLAFKETYSLLTYLTLVPITVGFSMAAGGDPMFEATGFAFAICSMCSLVGVNVLSRYTLAAAGGTDTSIHPLQLQAWMTTGSLLLLSAMDVALSEGGWGRLLSAAASSEAGRGTTLVLLAVAEGTLYHLSNVGTFTSIEIFEPLSFAIIDTLRRLCVVVSGFFYQGNPCTVINACGIVLVIGGAGAYNVVKGRAAKEQKKGKTQ
eukprot:COSAG02_NODE_1857_length_10645_cov_24.485302_7_plen_356_part_00